MLPCRKLGILSRPRWFYSRKKDETAVRVTRTASGVKRNLRVKRLAKNRKFRCAPLTVLGGVARVRGYHRFIRFQTVAAPLPLHVGQPPLQNPSPLPLQLPHNPGIGTNIKINATTATATMTVAVGFFLACTARLSQYCGAMEGFGNNARNCPACPIKCLVRSPNGVDGVIIPCFTSDWRVRKLYGPCLFPFASV